MQAIQSQFWAVRDYLSPVLRESKFKESGCITPEEFVAAGDFLAYKFPVWSWEKGDTSKAKDFLPGDKQYLVHRGVPCLRRASSLAYTDAQEDSERLVAFGGGDAGKEDEWVETHAGRPAHDSKQSHAIDDIPDLDGPSADDVADGVAGLSLGADNVTGNPPVGDIPDMDEIPDMEEAGLEDEDDAAVVAAPAKATAAAAATTTTDARGNLLSVRTYDVMITYDKYYQTPRVWLLGYDEKGNALTHKQVFEDISAEHAQKTVTIEAFPHSVTLSCASVHPCKHASVMKKVIERMNAHVIEEQRKAAGKPSPSAGKEAGGSNKRTGRWLLRKVTGDSNKSTPTPSAEEGDDIEGMRVDFYLVVFLKFIASIVPTIEVDSTTAL